MMENTKFYTVTAHFDTEAFSGVEAKSFLNLDNAIWYFAEQVNEFLNQISGDQKLHEDSDWYDTENEILHFYGISSHDNEWVTVILYEDSFGEKGEEK